MLNNEQLNTNQSITNLLGKNHISIEETIFAQFADLLLPHLGNWKEGKDGKVADSGRDSEGLIS